MEVPLGWLVTNNVSESEKSTEQSKPFYGHTSLFPELLAGFDTIFCFCAAQNIDLNQYIQALLR
jgi:hypothetical protein